MEYIEGADLSHRLSRADPQGGAQLAGQPYPLAEVLPWAVALCRTLEYLASKQPPVVHQDIKPANLLRDANSGQLYLVDFGAARAAAPTTPGQGTTIFGTPGYAAPEQYRGESGPPSDVYALAATLYHLATDDDPADHPFVFPRMNRLGNIGHVLRDALADDPALRPTAADLRRHIERLLLPDSARTMGAPDGEILQGESDLARWCERHWEHACAWLYGDMPELVERELVNITLAAQLRSIVMRNATDKNAGLDAAIARLDPKGYGASEPLLQMYPQQLDLGSFRADIPLPALVRISNTGRRYVRAEVVTPEWLAPGASHEQAEKAALAVRGLTSTQSMALDLTPGQEFTLSLALISSRAGLGSYKRSAIVLRTNKQMVARTSVSGTPVFSNSRLASSAANFNPYPLIAIMGFFGLIVICALLSAIR
jgi:serine/threonine protein kinase